MADLSAYTVESDTLALAKEAVKVGLIKQEVLDHLASLHPEVPNSMKHRYLLMQLHNVTRNDKELFAVMIQFLVQFQSPINNAIQFETPLSSGHISEITEFLASYAYKWQLIGTALNFHPQDLKNITAENTTAEVVYSLRELIGQWIEGRYKHTKSATLGNLVLALNSNTVGLGTLAQKLQNQKFTPTSLLPNHHSSLPYYVADVKVTEGQITNTDCITVEEKTSVILEIRGMPVSFMCQWTNNEQLIHDDEEHYTGSTSSIFLVSNVNINMDGCQYSCDVSKNSYTFKTKPVTLRACCPLDNFKPKLKSIYLAKPEVPADTWPPVSSKTFIDLILTKQDINHSTDYPYLTVKGDIDEILNDKEIVESIDILKGLKCGQLLLIEGRPGSGKTTFVHKITCDWANSYNGPIRILQLVSLRKLNNCTKLGLLDLFHLDLKMNKDLLEERNGEGVCFIFDGLDEFSPPDGEYSIVYKIIHREYLSQSIVIIASRPAAMVKLRNKADRVIEVLGFRRNQTLQYFDHYPFSCRNMSMKLRLALQSYPNILHMCYLPIHASMIAFLFQQTGKVPQTETEIYEHFTRFTFMRTISKNEDLTVESNKLNQHQLKVFNQICQLALEKTISKKQVLHQSEMEPYIQSESVRAFSMGFINIDRIAGLYGFHDIYSFLHLTLQEYLAACHISTVSIQEQVKLIDEHGNKDHMQVVWKFFCGIVKFEGSDSRFKALLHKTVKKNQLYFFQCAYESQQDTVCTQVLEGINYHITLKDSTLATPDLTAIGFVMRKSTIPIKMSIVNCDIKAATVDILWRHRENKTLIQIFNYMSDVIDNDKIDFIEKTLTNCSLLKVLRITVESCSVPNLAVLTVGIRHFPHLTSLSFSKILLGSRFFLLETDLPSNLQNLQLIESIHDRSTIKQLAKFLQCCKNLETIDLSKNQIDDVDAQILACGLKFCSRLKRVSIANNIVKFKGFNAILMSIRQYSVTADQHEYVICGNEVTYEELLTSLQNYSSCLWRILL